MSLTSAFFCLSKLLPCLTLLQFQHIVKSQSKTFSLSDMGLNVNKEAVDYIYLVRGGAAPDY